MNCHIHQDTKLICPKCFGARGGKKTKRKYTAEERVAWGKLGGRPPKQKEESK